MQSSALSIRANNLLLGNALGEEAVGKAICPTGKKLVFPGMSHNLAHSAGISSSKCLPPVPWKWNDGSFVHYRVVLQVQFCEHT